MDFNKMYCQLIDNGYFTEEELRLVTDINGNKTETLLDCIYVRYGYKTMEDLINE